LIFKKKQKKNPKKGKLIVLKKRNEKCRNIETRTDPTKWEERKTKKKQKTFFLSTQFQARIKKMQ
jgi:hypothetical protein